MLLLGFVIFLGGGAGAAYVGTRSPAAAPAVTKTQVLVAALPIEAGTAGTTAFTDGRIRTKAVVPSTVPAGAVSDPATLAGKVSAAPIAAGALITGDMFAAPQTRIGSVVVPPGMRALAMSLNPVPGVAGFVGAGDRIDVFAVASGERTAPAVRLVMQGVQVLNVNGAGLPTAQGQPAGPDLVYLLAVTPAQAERLIYLVEYEKLYFDLVPKGEGPVTTPGAAPASAFQAA